jgi:hypothetical protein
MGIVLHDIFHSLIISSAIPLLKCLKYLKSSGLTPYGVKPGVSVVSVVLMASEILAVCVVAQAAAREAFVVGWH